MPRRGFVLALGLTVLLLILTVVFGVFDRFRYGDLYETAEILDIIDNKYVDKIDVKKCQEKILRSGLQACLDPHSQYYSQDDIRNASGGDNAAFGGIGAEVDKHGDYIRVITPLEGTPAHKAGILPNDMIIAIDGASTKGMSLEEAVKKMRGNPGQAVTVTIQRANEKIKDIVLTREIIQILPVRTSFIFPDVLYIRLAIFDGTASFYFEEALADFQLYNAGAKEPLKGVVIDLRKNPGGVLGDVLLSTDLFSPAEDRVILTAQGVHTTEVYKTYKKGFYVDIPVVVLINGGSASAAEVLAGILQIWGHPVVGEKSYGKGTVQEFPIWLSSGGALRLTIARYFLGEKAVAVNGIGIKPDVEVRWQKSGNQTADDFKAEFYMNFGKADKDPQLKKAIEVLREQMKKPGN